MASTIQRKTFEWRQARVVVLILAGLALLAFAIYRVGKIFDVFADRYTIVTMLPNVAGLREGALVSLAGQRIGKVEQDVSYSCRAMRVSEQCPPVAATMPFGGQGPAALVTRQPSCGSEQCLSGSTGSRQMQRVAEAPMGRKMKARPAGGAVKEIRGRARQRRDIH